MGCDARQPHLDCAAMQSRIVLVVLAISACSTKTDKRPDLPANAFASLPKADWPCARRESEEIHRFHYTKTDACLIPMELVTEGLVGCAAQIDTFHPIKATYAGEHLVALDTYAVEWGKDSVHEVGHTTARHGGELECHRADGTLHWRLELDTSGRPTHETVFDRSNEPTEIAFTWEGKRLTRTELSSPGATTRYDMIYDCARI